MYSSKKNNPRGVALMIVLISLALMSALVSELSTKELVYYKLAINERDALKAEALAQSGVNLAQLVLLLQEPLQIYLTNFAKMGIPLPHYAVWELLPIGSDTLASITQGSLPEVMNKNEEITKAKEGGEKGKEKEKEKEKEKTTESKPKVGPYEVPPGGFGGFDGKFDTQITDEESKISIRKWAKYQSFPQRKMVYDQIYRILSRPENAKLFEDNKGIGPSQVAGNIYDWISDEDLAVDVTAPASDWGRILKGNKSSEYVDTPEIKPKKAPMDSITELRRVPGVTDAIYKLLSKYLTIYAEDDKINILTAREEMLASLFWVCAKNKESGPMQQQAFVEELLASWKKKKEEGGFNPSVEGVKAHLEENGVEVDEKECREVVGTESKTFTVKSTGTVGNVSRTLVVRLRSAGNITTIYQYQYW